MQGADGALAWANAVPRQKEPGLQGVTARLRNQRSECTYVAVASTPPRVGERQSPTAPPAHRHGRHDRARIAPARVLVPMSADARYLRRCFVADALSMPQSLRERGRRRNTL